MYAAPVNWSHHRSKDRNRSGHCAAGELPQQAGLLNPEAGCSVGIRDILFLPPLHARHARTVLVWHRLGPRNRIFVTSTLPSIAIVHRIGPRLVARISNQLGNLGIILRRPRRTGVLAGGSAAAALAAVAITAHCATRSAIPPIVVRVDRASQRFQRVGPRFGIVPSERRGVAAGVVRKLGRWVALWRGGPTVLWRGRSIPVIWGG